MYRTFQNVRTGELIYIDDASPEYKEFLKKRLEAEHDNYMEWFTMMRR